MWHVVGQGGENSCQLLSKVVRRGTDGRYYRSHGRSLLVHLGEAIVLFIVSMVCMLLSGGWPLLVMAPFMVTITLPLVYYSHMYVVISQCPHPGVNDACHMGEGGMWSLAPILRCCCNNKLRSAQRIMGFVSVSVFNIIILFTAFGIAYQFTVTEHCCLQHDIVRGHMVTWLVRVCPT